MVAVRSCAICCNGVECLLAVVGNAEKMVMRWLLAVAAEQVVNCAVVWRAEVWQFCCSGVVVVVVCSSRALQR